MTRTSRIFALVCAGAVAVAVATPGLASADDAAPTFSRSGVTDLDPSPLYAGYTASLVSTKSVSGTLTLPNLGACNRDGGLLLAIELSNVSGSNYVDGGAYSSCVGGTKTHSIVIESTAEGQIVIGVGNDGDKIKVDQKVLANNDVEISVTNVTQGTPAVTDVITGAIVQVATSMHWGQISVGGEPVPTLNYNRLSVTNVKVGGKTLKSSGPTKYDFSPSGDVVLRTSRIKSKMNYSTTNVT